MKKALILVASVAVLIFFGQSMRSRDIRNAKDYCEALAWRIREKYPSGGFPDRLEPALFGYNIPPLIKLDKLYIGKGGTFSLTFIEPPSASVVDLYIYDGKGRSWIVLDMDVPRK